MKIALSALAATGLLCGCTAGSIDARLQSSLPDVCAAIAGVDAAFQTLTLSGTVPQKVVSAEAVGMAGIGPICADPSAVSNPAAALQTAAKAYVAVVNALRDAKAAR